MPQSFKLISQILPLATPSAVIINVRDHKRILLSDTEHLPSRNSVGLWHAQVRAQAVARLES